MHRLINDTPIDLGPYGTLNVGDWVVSDRNAFQMASMGIPGTVHMERYYPEAYSRSDDRILIQRSGAWGDLMFLTPVLRKLQELDRENPLDITLSCFEKHHSLFRGNPNVTTLRSYPFPFVEAGKFESVTSLEEVVEHCHYGHASQAIASAFRLSLTLEECRYDFFLTEEEIAEGLKTFPRTSRPRISLQLAANSRARTWPIDQWAPLVMGLIEKEFEVFVFGSAVQNAPIPDLPDPARLVKISHPFREAAAIMKTCDVHVGVDSAWLHMAAALGIPAVGLFGSTNWNKVVMPGSNTLALTGTGDCARCDFQPYGNFMFPRDKECAKTGICSVLGSIPIPRIIAKTELQLKGVAEHHE